MDLKSIKKKAKKEIESAKDFVALKHIFQVFFGKKGEIAVILSSLKNLPQKERKDKGKIINEVKKEILEMIVKKENDLKKIEAALDAKEEWIDISFPSKKIPLGHLHPLTQARRKTEEIFEKLGFSVIEGPQIETEWYNFDALNIPKDHPARDRWDTFWLRESESQKPKVKSQRLLLRTHTSPVQIRYMEKNNPPLRIIVPGRIFRYEATDASHEINFYQLEGLMVDSKVTLADFKGVMEKFFQMFFGDEAKIRLRPSYFPFTEPSVEIDISCRICKQKGCSACGQKGWVEIAGAGMVHPNVFKAANLNPKNWQGFALGMGLDRLAMMKYRINDIRLFYGGDLRFLEQF